MSDMPRDPKSLLGDTVIPPLYATEHDEHMIARVRIYMPHTMWSWYVIEHERGECFGLVCGFEAEFGYFTLDELLEIEVNGQRVQRDETFQPTNARAIKRAHDDRDGDMVILPEPTTPPPTTPKNPILVFIALEGEDTDWDAILDLFE